MGVLRIRRVERGLFGAVRKVSRRHRIPDAGPGDAIKCAFVVQVLACERMHESAKVRRRSAENLAELSSEPMPPRLLSLLASIEDALGDIAPVGRVTRSADYGKGVARMTFADGTGSIVLKSFVLTEGQLCVRVELRRAGASAPGATAIYPQSARDWAAATVRIAETWFDLAAEPDSERSSAA